MLTKLTQHDLKKVLRYNKTTGLFTRKVLVSGPKGSKDFVGSIHKGYVRICVYGVVYQAHRLAWLYVYGVFPVGLLDHKNCISTDNRIKNLREPSSSENGINRRLQRNNSSGYKGISFKKAIGKWQVQLRDKGKKIYLGVFSSKEKAHAVYVREAKLRHGLFFNPG